MIYFDNNATTPLDERVLEAMLPYLREEFGNPSSKHYSLATQASRAVEEARIQVARLINASPEQIIFTSSGTESNNIIIKGAADFLKNYLRKGNHLLTSQVEHKSIINSFGFLNGEIYNNRENKYEKIDRGYRGEILGVNEKGLMDLSTIESALREDTILGSFIWVNNETGNINRIEEIVEIFRARDIFIHSDATQAVGKLAIDVKDLDIDALSFSAHKLYGPKGAGACYLKEPDKISSLLSGGGGQEMGVRSGTLCVHNIVGFGKACQLAYEERAAVEEKTRRLGGEFRRALKNKYPDIIFVTDEEEGLPGLVSFILPEKNSTETILRLKDQVAMSSGSACSAGGESPVLTAIGKEEYGSNFYRMGINKYTSLEEIKKVVDLI